MLSGVRKSSPQQTSPKNQNPKKRIASRSDFSEESFTCLITGIFKKLSDKFLD